MMTVRSTLYWVLFLLYLMKTQITMAHPLFEESETGEEGCGVLNVDYQVDRLLEEAKSRLDDPMDLPNKNGLLNLVAGQLWGLRSLNRSGPVIVACNSSTLILRIPLFAAKPLRARYEWDKKVLSHTEKGVANARVSYLEALVTVQSPRLYTSNKLPSEPRVTELEITRLADVEVNISGLAHFSWLWSRSIEFMSNIFERALTLSVQDRFWLALDEALQRSDSIETTLLY